MKQTKRSSRDRASARRWKLLAAFDRSGLSASAFARRHSLNYTTFCGWRKRRDRSGPVTRFVQVNLSAPARPVELQIELGSNIRLRIGSTDQVELAARLVQALNTSK